MHNKTIPILDARLKAVAELVRQGSVCADIGCDHGKLSAFLASSGTCKKVIACDKSEKPLDKTKKIVNALCLENVECRKGDGLNIISPQEVDDIVIAGLSGVTLAQIILAAKEFWCEKFRFILVPASKPDYLRRFLYENGFELLSENPVLAQNRVYTVMHVKYTGKIKNVTPLFCLVGLINGTSSAANAYKEKIIKHLQKQGDTQLIKEVEQWFLQNK